MEKAVSGAGLSDPEESSCGEGGVPWARHLGPEQAGPQAPRKACGSGLCPGTTEGALIPRTPGGKGTAGAEPVPGGCDLVHSGAGQHPLANVTLQQDQQETADRLAERHYAQLSVCLSLA